MTLEQLQNGSGNVNYIVIDNVRNGIKARDYQPALEWLMSYRNDTKSFPDYFEAVCTEVIIEDAVRRYPTPR